MSWEVQGETLFLSDKITHTEELGASKSVIQEGKSRADRGSGMEKSPLFHFYSQEVMWKQWSKGMRQLLMAELN